MGFMDTIFLSTLMNDEEEDVRLQGFLFIDGEFLRKYYSETICKWTDNQGEIDFGNLNSAFQHPAKCFYYDCLDNIKHESENEEEFINRKKEQEALFSKIRSVRGTHVRLGRLVGSENKKGPRRQKEVDILLAVDMLEHATRQNMSAVTLITGDGDFKPLVEAIVRLGLNITIAGFPQHTSQELAEAADFYKPITISDCYRWSTESLRQRFPCPVLKTDQDKPDLSEYPTLLSRGIIAEKPVSFYESTNKDSWLAIIDQGIWHHYYTFTDYDKLKLFLELEKGQLTLS